MKKKIIIIICIIISISLIISGIYLLTTKESEPKKEKYDIVCTQIEKSENAKENFVIIVKSESTMNGDVNDTVNEFKTKYKDVNIYEIKIQKLSTNCIKSHLEKTGYYEELVRNKITTIMGYKNGEIAGVMQNPSSIGTLENHFQKLGVIKIPVIKEQNLTYEKYKENIEEYEDYIISVITREDARQYTSENTKKIFPNVKNDVINLNSDEGIKIFEDIESKTKMEQIYPHIFYFKNGNIIANHSGGFISEIEEFKNLVEEILQKQ